MILSDKLTVGQLTFVFRIVIQILSYGGPALIGLAILGSVPRLAPVDTHDTVNRIVGASTATRTTGKWILNRVRHKSSDPTPPTKLIFILTLAITYTTFISLGDIGFLGFYTCSVPGSSFLDFPASLTSDDAARSFIINTNIAKGYDLASVNAWRCDSSSPTSASDHPIHECTSWKNSTYADPTLFTGINSTDSDVLLSRQLRPSTDVLTRNFAINAFYFGPEVQPLLTPTISNGLAINPHPTGVQIIAGVPQLSPNQRVTIPQTMAIEVEVGCMGLGFESVLVAGDTFGYDFLVVNDTWEKYVGPDYLRDTLFQSATETRVYLLPFFNQTEWSSGRLISTNETHEYELLTRPAKVSRFSLPFYPSAIMMPDPPDLQVMTDCSMSLRKKLGLTQRISPDLDNITPMYEQMCGYFGAGGSKTSHGLLGFVFEHMICASATQVNMVSSTISVSSTNVTNITISRLPSTLNYFYADFYQRGDPNSSEFTDRLDAFWTPYERYTLTPSPNGPISHFVSPDEFLDLEYAYGVGSGGNFISELNSFPFNADLQQPLAWEQHSPLMSLPSGFTPLTDITPVIVTEWIGRALGSVVTASVSYNGWAARQIPPVLVTSTGGHSGTCYSPLFALSFLPLILATILTLIWALISLFQGSLVGSKQVERIYGGLAPYRHAISSRVIPGNILLIWKQYAAHPWLQVVRKGYAITGNPGDTLLHFLKAQSAESNET